MAKSTLPKPKITPRGRPRLHAAKRRDITVLARLNMYEYSRLEEIMRILKAKSAARIVRAAIDHMHASLPEGERRLPCKTGMDPKRKVVGKR